MTTNHRSWERSIGLEIGDATVFLTGGDVGTADELDPIIQMTITNRNGLPKTHRMPLVQAKELHAALGMLIAKAETDLPTNAVFALAHLDVSDSYFGFGWRIVERTPLGLIIGGPKQYAHWQVLRLANGMRALGESTYASPLQARAAIIDPKRLNYTTTDGRLRIYEGHTAYYIVLLETGEEACMGDGVDLFSIVEDGERVTLSPGTWLFNTTIAHDLETDPTSYSEAYFGDRD